MKKREKKRLKISCLMTKKIIFTVVILTVGSGTKMTALAKPQTMPDGTVFDAEYYAETYPDVKAVFGTDEKALYNHYVQYGKSEGRSPALEGAQATTETSSRVTQNGVLMEEGDENYWRAGTVSIGSGYGYIVGCNKWPNEDPANGMVRSDMTSDPYYQAIRNEVIDAIQSSEEKTNVTYYCKYLYNPGDWEHEKHYRQVRFNLCIDLVKEGILKRCYLMDNPADGGAHYGGMDYDFVTIAYINYDYDDRTEMIQMHPELKGYY